MFASLMPLLLAFLAPFIEQLIAMLQSFLGAG